MATPIVIDLLRAEQRMADATVEALPPHGGRVLEAGRMTPVRAALLAAGAWVFDANLVEMDVQALPFRAQCFDVTYANRLFEMLDDATFYGFLQELMRVTRRRLVLHFPLGLLQSTQRMASASRRDPPYLHLFPQTCACLVHGGFSDVIVHDYRLTPNIIILASRPEEPHVEPRVCDA